MRKMIKKYFIPHETNDYKPHFLRQESIHFLIFLVFVVFIGSFTMKSIADTSGLLPKILPEVLIKLTNDDRNTNQLALLSPNQKLVEAATLKASDMASNSYFSHVSPNGVDPWYWFKKAGYLFLYAGENLAINFKASNDIESAWMNSPGHRANILNPNYKEIGVAVKEGLYEGRPTTYVVQLFGSPAATLPLKIQAPKLAFAEAPTAQQKEIKVISETPIAIGVKATDESLIPAPVTAAPQDIKISWFERFFVNPSRLMKEVYLVLGAIILLAILLHIFIEVKHQHLPSIFSGVLVLLFMAGLYVLYVTTIGASFVIL